MSKSLQEEKLEWEKEFRSIFKPVMANTIKPGYEGSYMLYVPYEEMVYYIEKTVSLAEERGRREERFLWTDKQLPIEIQRERKRISEIIKGFKCTCSRRCMCEKNGAITEILSIINKPIK